MSSEALKRIQAEAALAANREMTVSALERIAALDAALAVAREREQRHTKALRRIADAGTGIPDWRSMADCARAALVDEPAAATCICTRFRDLPEGTIIADLTCPVHGVNGTEPGDVLPDEYYAAADEPGETPDDAEQP